MQPSSCAAVRRGALAAWLFALAELCGCTSPDRLTADALHCSTRDVEIVPSGFQRRGMETAWCATCKGKLYVCATNAQRSHTVCREAQEGDGCF
jgi:hypothetical protein